MKVRIAQAPHVSAGWLAEPGRCMAWVVRRSVSQLQKLQVWASANVLESMVIQV